MFEFTGRRDPENASEDNEEAVKSDDEAKETLMEANCNREAEAHEDYKMTETDSFRFLQQMSQGKPIGLLDSEHFIMPESFSNKQESYKKRVNKLGTFESQKSVYATDYKVHNYSPKTRRRLDRATDLPNKSYAGIKAWKY